MKPESKRATVAAALLSCTLVACKPGLDTHTAETIAAKLDAPYDYYLIGMHTERFDGIGKRLMLLTAPRMNHFADDDHAELETPQYHWFRDQGAPWLVSSDTGNVHHVNGNDEIALNGNVKASTTLEETGPLLVETSRMLVMPAAKSARTDAVADISTGSFHQRGTGMQLDLSNNTISLLKDVRGTYVP
ncbi:MAG TPA: LPS export ABC transporter periplasmic protein LptC [Candidatus Acidoferrum sp.]|nr:LPS export ABC transporter periplasmic protein LptC [Candidatus Acidoferrum sp.]